MAETNMELAHVATSEGHQSSHSAFARLSPRALLPLAILLGALALNLYRLGSPSLWMDESFSVELARQPLSVLYGAFISGSEPNMILYHVLLHGWLAIGTAFNIPATEFFVRFPSAVFTAFSALVVFQIGRRFLSDTTAVVGALLYMLTGLVLTYAQQTRSYGLQLLLVCVTWYALLTLLYRGGATRRWWAVYVGACVLAVYAHAFSMLLLVAQAVTFGLLLLLDTPVRGRTTRHLAGMVASWAVIGVCITPFLYASRHGAKNGWLPSPQVGPVVSRIVSEVSKSKASLALLSVVVAVVIVALICSRLPAGRRVLSGMRTAISVSPEKAVVKTREAAPVLLALACWLVVPTVLSYFLSQGSIRLFSSRYLVTVVPAACLLVGAAISFVRWRFARVFLGAGLVCAALVTVPGYYAHAQLEDWRTPTRWIESHFQAGDGLVSYNNVQGAEFPIAYYLQTDGSAAHFTADSPGYVDVSLYGHGDPYAHFGDALHPDALARFAATHPRIFFIEGRFTDAHDAALAHAAQSWLDAHYRLVGQTSSAVVTIRLYATTQPPTP